MHQLYNNFNKTCTKYWKFSHSQLRVTLSLIYQLYDSLTVNETSCYLNSIRHIWSSNTPIVVILCYARPNHSSKVVHSIKKKNSNECKRFGLFGTHLMLELVENDKTIKLHIHIISQYFHNFKAKSFTKLIEKIVHGNSLDMGRVWWWPRGQRCVVCTPRTRST